MRLVLDQGVPRDAAGLLRQLGYECIHTGEAGMSMASDEEILAWAREQGAIVVTLDADFHAILAVSGASGPSVVRIRREGLGAQAAVELLSQILVTYSSDLAAGTLLTIKSKKITQHRLPVGRQD